MSKTKNVDLWSIELSKYFILWTTGIYVAIENFGANFGKQWEHLFTHINEYHPS